METQEIVSDIFKIKQEVKKNIQPIFDKKMEQHYATQPFWLFGKKYKEHVKGLNNIIQEYNNHPLVLELKSLTEKCPHDYSNWQLIEHCEEERQCLICDKKEYRTNLSYSGTMLG